MENLRQLLGDFGGLVQGTVVVILVALALITLNRILNRGTSGITGHRFRNQLIISAAGFVGVLAVILGLPLDDTVRGQLLTLVGILISAAIALSSGSFLSNAMAGIMLKTVRNFRSGDFITAGEHFGRVTERGLFHTEIQTPDRDLTTLPNLLLATSAVKVVRQSGTIVSATVSLGYDVPRDRIEKLLLEAARSIGLEDSFVQILDLGDFSVTYRTAGLLKEAKQLISFRSRLRAAILDSLHRGGIEIVSPDFTNARVFQPDQKFIPPVKASTSPSVKDSAPVNVVFDKAEDAESLSRLRELFMKTEVELRDLAKEMKDASDDAARLNVEKRLTRMENKKKSLLEAIARAEEKESRHEEDR